MAQRDSSHSGERRASLRVRTKREGWTHGGGADQLANLSRALNEPQPPPDHVPGEVIQDRYELRRMMGDGGMGEVWLARHLALDAEVAVKLTKADVLAAESVDHLLHEARILSRLDHPSIVRVVDFGVAERGFPYLVIELLRGPSLRQMISRRGRLSPKAAVRLLLPVASALAATHAQGIVHRDLKPDNVILVPGSSGTITPKVFDFGIAEYARDPSMLTEDGTLVGSPEYMSPEQVRADVPVDARTDVWAFCVVFYELVTGCSPFARGALTATLDAVVGDAVAPLAGSGADGALASIIARGLAKDRDARWPSMRALGEHLAAWALREGVEEDVAGTSLRTHWLCPVAHPLSDPSPPPAWRPAEEVPTRIMSAEIKASQRAPRRRGSVRQALVGALSACLLVVGAGALVPPGAPVSREPSASQSEAPTLSGTDPPPRPASPPSGSGRWPTRAAL